jgi:hypothetical protein
VGKETIGMLAGEQGPGWKGRMLGDGYEDMISTETEASLSWLYKMETCG